MPFRLSPCPGPLPGDVPALVVSDGDMTVLVINRSTAPWPPGVFELANEMLATVEEGRPPGRSLCLVS